MTAALSQSGQRTPCGQRCWRTRSKHLASSSSAERLTNSDTAMMTASSSNQDEILGPSNRMSSATAIPPEITTPKPDKSHPNYEEIALPVPTFGRSGLPAIGLTPNSARQQKSQDRSGLQPNSPAFKNPQPVERLPVGNST